MTGIKITKRFSILGSLVVVGLGVAAVLIVTISFATAASTDWPPFSMVYGTEGATVTVGSEPSQALRKVHRLEYRSKTEWLDTVIDSPDIETKVGLVNNVGSYRQLSGRDYSEFDAINGSTHSERIDEGVRRVPGPALKPYPIELLRNAGVELSRVATTATVCFEEACKERAEGLMFMDNGQEFVLANDSRGIPLRVGDSFFSVRELRIEDSKR